MGVPPPPGYQPPGYPPPSGGYQQPPSAPPQPAYPPQTPTYQYQDPTQQYPPTYGGYPPPGGGGSSLAWLWVLIGVVIVASLAVILFVMLSGDEDGTGSTTFPSTVTTAATSVTTGATTTTAATTTTLVGSTTVATTGVTVPPLDTTTTTVTTETGQATIPPPGTELSVFDLVVGMCFDQIVDATNVRAVDCGGTWEFRVVEIFDMPQPAGDPYPGDEVTQAAAQDGCDAPTTQFYIPTADTWDQLDDREIVCLEEFTAGG